MRTGPVSLSWPPPPPRRLVAKSATKSRMPRSSPVLLPPLNRDQKRFNKCRAICKTNYWSKFINWFIGLWSTLRICIRVEWFSLFCDFRKRAHCFRLTIFLWVQIQKIAEFCRVRARRMRGKILSFKKSLGPWKWIFFLSRHEPSSYIKD